MTADSSTEEVSCRWYDPVCRCGRSRYCCRIFRAGDPAHVVSKWVFWVIKVRSPLSARTSGSSKIARTNWSQRFWLAGLVGSMGVGLLAGSAWAQDAPQEVLEEPAAPATEVPVPDETILPDAEPITEASEAVPAATISEREAENLMRQADAALGAQNYDRAIELLQQAFTAFNTRSNYYQQLSGVFAGVDNAIADEHRLAARDSAEERDRASYDLAIVYRAADRPEEAIGPLVQVVASQGPTRELGQKAYQQLREIGFVTTAFPR
ncbi:MAG: tetratricopeptide repeat protein [Cyanobacteria bacterium P01_F01_bin.33]